MFMFVIEIVKIKPLVKTAAPVFVFIFMLLVSGVNIFTSSNGPYQTAFQNYNI